MLMVLSAHIAAVVFISVTKSDLTDLTENIAVAGLRLACGSIDPPDTFFSSTF